MVDEKQKDDERKNTAMTTSNSKKVTLSNEQTFFARYERTSRQNLPRKVAIKKVEKLDQKNSGPRKTQQGGSILGK